MKIDYSKKFLKQFQKCPNEIRIKFKERLEIFILNKNNIILNNHSLTGKLKDSRSINITGDWRAIYQEFYDGKAVLFVAIGMHSQLYK